eukprot:15232688-Alexandrium_andersonii.AAC.1
MHGTHNPAPGPGWSRGCFPPGVAPQRGPTMTSGLRLPDVGHLVEDEDGVGAAIASGQEVGAPSKASDPR